MGFGLIARLARCGFVVNASDCCAGCYRYCCFLIFLDCCIVFNNVGGCFVVFGLVAVAGLLFWFGPWWVTWRGSGVLLFVGWLIFRLSCLVGVCRSCGLWNYCCGLDC